jgi:hypothetical protein
MSSSWRDAAAALADDLKAVFGPRLRSVVAYGAHLDGDSAGPITALALVSSLTIEDLDACASHTGRWGRLGLAPKTSSTGRSTSSRSSTARSSARMRTSTAATPS